MWGGASTPESSEENGGRGTAGISSPGAKSFGWGKQLRE